MSIQGTTYLSGLDFSEDERAGRGSVADLFTTFSPSMQFISLFERGTERGDFAGEKAHTKYFRLKRKLNLKMSLPPSSLPSPQEGLHLLSSEKEYRGECRSESSSREQKRGSQAGQTQVRDPGCTPRPPSTVLHDIQPQQGPRGEGTQAWGYITQTTLQSSEACKSPSDPTQPSRNCFRHQEMYGDKTPHKEKAPHQRVGWGTYYDVQADF